MAVRVECVHELNNHMTRYWLSNGWFIARTRKAAYRQFGYHFNLWKPGAGHDGTALRLDGAHNLRDILALANRWANLSA